MTEVSKLDHALRAIRSADMHSSGRENFSVEEFSKQAVARLILAMDQAREPKIQTDQ